MTEYRKLRQSRASIQGRLTRINNSVVETTHASEAKVKLTKIEEL